MNRVEFGDDGMYKCVAENSAGRVETEVRINVLVKPQIYELLNVTEPVTNETRITCKTKGRPPPRVTFRKLSNRDPFSVGQQPEDERITLTQESAIDRGEASGTLHIKNLSRSDDGLYQCIAENKPGAAYRNGHITVWFKPTFNRTRDLPPVWSWDGRPGNLSCLPEAIPNATIVWRWNQVEISEENFSNGRVSRNNFQGFVPGHIGQVRPNTVTATTIKFSIVPPSNYDGLPIRSYSVQYKPERQPSWENALQHTWSNGAPYIVENLFPEVTYHFRFAARNDVGLGPWSNAPSTTMPRRSVPAEPTVLLPVNLTYKQELAGPYSNHFELRWNVPADNGEPIEYYLVRYCKIERNNGEESEVECSENIQQSVQYTNYPLENLMPDTIYKVELRAHNAIGDSTPATIRIRTARGEPHQYFNYKTDFVGSGCGKENPGRTHHQDHILYSS
ncbi:hypothetical protein HUJ04_009041 [Dendroctonus ponderosae]|nr:hypothetical protein HUJ04_009041 [Dendroctonus ponderosae]